MLTYDNQEEDMDRLEVIIIYSGARTSGRPEVRTAKTFVIENVTDDDRDRLRGVLDSDDFRGKFGVSGSTQDSRVVLYYDDIAMQFSEMFDKLVGAVTDALATNKPARVY